MMVTLNALERTSKQYEQLLYSAGLEVVNIYAVGTNEEAILEIKVKPSTK
jgi:hypothetical protein